MGYLGRGALVWVAIAITEVVHGILRNLLLEPRVGDLASRQIGVFTGSILILAIGLLSIRWIGPRGKAECLAVGAVWLVLMLSFEIGLGRALGMSWDRIASDYDFASGGLMVIGMSVVLVTPLVASTLRDRH